MKHVLLAALVAACGSNKPAGLSPGRYDVAVHINVKPKHWIRLEPDLVVALWDADTQVDTCRIEHDSTGDCHFNGVLDDPQQLELVLVGRNGGATLPPDTTTHTLVEMKTRGEVKSAEVTLAYGPPWFAIRIAALGVGIAAALLSMRVFRRQLFVEPSLPRCTHCGKRIAEDALKCDHCGAAQ